MNRITTIYIPDSDFEIINDFAHRNKLKKSDIYRQAVKYFIETYIDESDYEDGDGYYFNKKY